MPFQNQSARQKIDNYSRSFHEKFSFEQLNKLNRVELFEILYRIEQQNSQLKEDRGLSNVTMQRFCKIQKQISNFNQLSQQGVFESKRKTERIDTKSHGKENVQELLQKASLEFLLIDSLLSHNQSIKSRNHVVSRLNSHISFTKSQLDDLKVSIAELQLSERQLKAKVQELQEKIKLQEQNDEIFQKQNQQGQPQDQEFSEDGSQVDHILQELYFKVKQVMQKDS